MSDLDHCAEKEMEWGEGEMGLVVEGFSHACSFLAR